MKELFIDASRGLAGDMICASLLALFDDQKAAVDMLNALAIPGVRYELHQGKSYEITGNRLSVLVDGQEEGAKHEHHHEHHHEHGHDHNHNHDHEHRHHEHRSLRDIDEVIAQTALRPALREKVRVVYRLVAEAEAKVHGSTVELVHFHELGALDAVADIAAACALIDALAPEEITVSPVCTGFGSVSTAHGLLPVPAPATARILEGVPCYAGNIEGELCTPTGAALVRHFATRFAQMPLMTISAEGYGLGKKDFGCLSCVRTALGETDETMIELCCNVDDMSPEAVGFAIDELLRAGAPDAWYEPIGMKKNRPGLLLCCLCREEQREAMLRLLFRHTTTIGVRETICRRYVLKRREELQATPYGPVRVKISEGWGLTRRKAEFDDLARIAREKDLSLDEVEKMLREHGREI